MHTPSSLLRAGLALLLLVGLGGCFNPFNPKIATTAGVYVPPPSPASPQGVIKLLEWCWNNRDVTRAQELYTADYRFVFGLADSAGNEFRDKPVTREVELDIERNLFVGGGNEPPATSITLHFNPTLTPMDDSRPGKNRRWHQETVTSVDLSIRTDTQEYRITGNARFFTERGDSALIPAVLGFKPDSTRWYIDQWNDETQPGSSPEARTATGTMGTLRTPIGAIAVTSVRRVPLGRDGAAAAGDLPIDVSWGELKALFAR